MTDLPTYSKIYIARDTYLSPSKEGKVVGAIPYYSVEQRFNGGAR
jgi:hypothetical protein